MGTRRMTAMRRLRAFGRDDSGAATIELVALTASLLVSAMLALHPLAVSIQETVPGINEIVSSRMAAGEAAEQGGRGQFSEGAQMATAAAREAGQGKSGKSAPVGFARGHANSFGWKIPGKMNSWR